MDIQLAEVYGTETRRLKEAVRRSIKRFPYDFMFELTKSEFDNLRSQFATSNKRGGTRYMPFAFTEHGVSMLSSVLHSDIAIEININIIRTFIAVRQLIYNKPVDKFAELQNEVKELREYIEEVFTDYNDINEDTRMQLELINETLAELQADKKLNKPRIPIGFVKPEE